MKKNLFQKEFFFIGFFLLFTPKFLIVNLHKI